jgi:hypothetical protein
MVFYSTEDEQNVAPTKRNGINKGETHHFNAKRADHDLLLTISQPGKSLQHGIFAATLYHRSRSSDRQMRDKAEIENSLSICTRQLFRERN